MMRYFFILLLLGLWLPALGQPVLTITDNRKASPVAPFAYFYEDLTNRLTYEQVASLPIDSFQAINRQRAIQLGIRLGTVWVRLQVQNQTRAELFLFSSYWKYGRMDVYILDQNGLVNRERLEAGNRCKVKPIGYQ